MNLIVIDDREGRSGLAERVRRATPWPVEIARLEIGDIAIGERIVIERKRVDDLIAAIAEGRLARQAAATAGLRGVRALWIVEGDLNAATRPGLDAGDARRAVLDLALEWRLPVLFARDVEETAEWIAAAARREALGGAGEFAPLDFQPGAPIGRGPAPVRGRRATAGDREPAEVQIAMLRRIDGVGEGLARRMLERFGSIQEIGRAGEEDLLTIRGIGPGLAATIRRRLG